MQSSNQQDCIAIKINLPTPASSLMAHFRLQNVNFRPATPPRVSSTKQQHLDRKEGIWMTISNQYNSDKSYEFDLCVDKLNDMRKGFP